MKMNMITIPALCLFTALSSGCASMGRKLDTAKMDKVRKVVVLSFEVRQSQPTDNLGIGALKGERPDNTEELKDMAKDVYAQLVNELSRTLGKPVLGYTSVTSNPAYKAVVNKSRDGVQIKTFAGIGGNGPEIIWVEGILDDANTQRMTYGDRVKLAKALGADAFVMFTVSNEIDQSMYSFGHLTGDAAFSFVGRSNLRMFALDSEEPIWQIQNIDGEKSRSSDELGKVSKFKKLATLGKESSTSSIKKLVSEYSVQ